MRPPLRQRPRQAVSRDGTADGLPEKREEQQIAQAVYQRLIAKRDGLDAEAERAKSTLARLDADVTRIGADIAREGDLRSDAQRALDDLQTEQGSLTGQESTEGLIAQAAQHAAAATLVTDAEAALDTLSARAAAATAQRSAAERAKQGRRKSTGPRPASPCRRRPKN